MRNKLQNRKKHSKISIKAFVLLLLIVIEAAAFSQDIADSARIKVRPGFFTGFNAGISKSQIISEGALSVAGMKTVKSNSFSGMVEIGYFFTGGFSLSTGVGINSFNGRLVLDDYSNKLMTTDSENESYEKRITGSGITEDQNISCLNIPLCLNLRIPGSSFFGIFIECGINVSLPLTKEYRSSGVFTFKGYYPAYNVLLEDLPEYGLQSNAAVLTAGELLLNSYYFSGLASAGFQFLIANKIQLSAGATYSKSLSDIGGYTDQDKFQLATDENLINSMLGGSNRTLAESVGLKLSLRYFFKRTR